MIESGSCGAGLIATTSECEAAATALDLLDKTASDFISYQRDYQPPGCSFRPAGYLDVYGDKATGSCSSYHQCICKSTPPPPPPPPALPPSPPMLPGYLHIAGGYYMIESGSCRGGHVFTKSECEAAATALDLSDKSATDHTSDTYSSWPPGCVLYHSRSLRVYGGGSTGSCSSSQPCICKSTPP